MSTLFDLVFDAGGYFAVSIVGIMGIAYVILLVVRLCDKTPRPMMAERSLMALGLSAIGIPVFLLGLVIAFLSQPMFMKWGFVLAIGGFLAALGGAFLNAAGAKSKRAAWPVINARCTRQKLQFFRGGDDSEGWFWDVACEVDYAGKRYEIAPEVHWSDLGQAAEPFRSEEKARQYLSRKISATGECRVRINPADPQEGELL